jgi:hypothetical protein
MNAAEAAAKNGELFGSARGSGLSDLYACLRWFPEHVKNFTKKLAPQKTVGQHPRP